MNQDFIKRQVEPFWSECNKLHEEYAKNQFSNNQCTIYHYTNYEGLCGILKNRKLWYTNYRYLNDKSEIQFGFDLRQG